MARTSSNRLIHLITVLLFLQPSSFALRDYVIEFVEFKCIVNKIYVQSVSCSVDKHLEQSVLNIDIQMKKEVQRSFVDILVYISSPKREPVVILKVDRMDYCSLYKIENGNPIINMLRNVTAKHGNPPDTCPIAADYHYKFSNIAADPEYLPAVVPKVAFKMIFIYYDNKVPYFNNVTISGKVVYKKSKNKGRKNY